MTVSIDATNLTLVDVGDSTTGWTSSMGGLNTTTILTREGGVSLQDQASQEQYNVYHTISSVNLSAGFTVFGWMRSGGPSTEADASGAGFAMYLGDGTNNRAYDVGGSDNYAFFFSGWSNFRLNTVGLPTSFIQDGGGAPSLTAVTRIGYGGQFPAKAAGNSDNVAFDVLRYVSNAVAALLIEGGAAMTPGLWSEVVADDESTSNAYGIIRELVGGSKAYEVMFGLQVGSLDADSFFDDSDFQLFLNGSMTSGGSITAGSMDFVFAGGAMNTNLINFTNFFVQSVGTVSNWDVSDTNIDTLHWRDGQFVDMGTFLFQAQDAGNKDLTNIIWVNCAKVDFVGIDADGCTFNGASDADGAVEWNANSVEENQDNLTFNSDGTGHAIHINIDSASPTVLNIEGYIFDGYAGQSGTAGNRVFFITNPSDGDITINLSNCQALNVQGGGAGFSFELDAGTTSTVTTVSTVTLTVGGLTEGAAVKVLALESVGAVSAGDTVLQGLADANGEVSTSSFNYEGDLDVVVRARQQGLPNAAIQDDNGAFTDETTAANSSAVDDMNLLPATPVVNEDSYLFGHSEQFGQLKLDISTAGTGGFGITWEYWDGDTWEPLTGVSDGTSSFSNSGENTVSWTIPGDWATTTINSQGPFYYVRARYTSGSVTVVPDARKVKLDVTRYLPFTQDRTIESTGLSVVATWVEDAIASF